MAIKIGVIGAGSGIFSLNMIKDICLTPRLANSEICFMDIDEERLNASYTLCTRFAEEQGIKLNIKKTLDRKECLQDADFVINTVLIGGYKGWKEGWEIGKKWGYRYGGSLHIMHDEAFWINFYQLRMMEEILLDIKAICPNAWYIMIANPVMAGTTYLRRKYPEVKMVGLCHGYGGVYNLAEKLGLDKDEITYQIPGVNHFVWLNRFYYKGEDAFPLIDKWIEEESEEYFKTCKFCDGCGPKAIDLYKRYGVFPIGDTGNPGGGAWGWFYHTDGDVEKKWNEDPDTWFKDYFVGSMNTVEKVKEAAYDTSRKVTEIVGTEHSHEPMIPLIESLAYDVERVIIVNVLNDRNYVPGVPTDFEVEIPAWVSKDKIQGIATEPLPKPILSYIHRDRVAPVEMELEAFVKGDKNLLVDLVMMDPFTHSREQAEGLVEEILNLPYHTEMKEWYK
jgi:alpha-galactosidase